MTSDDIMTERVCIAGATGHLGSALVKEFCGRNVNVVAMARNSSSPNVGMFREIGVTVEFVDASKPQQESYGRALSSATVAISCLASRIENVDRTNDFWAIDRDAVIRFGREALKAGVRHLLVVSTFEGQDSRHTTEFSEAKEAAVDVLREECCRKDVAFTVIRPNAYYKDLTDHAFERALLESTVRVTGDGSHRINPISREDVAIFMSDCVQSNRGGDFKLGGPDIFSFREIGILAARVIGNEGELRITSRPLWKLRLKALIFRMLGYVFRPMRRWAAIFYWMVYVSSHDGVAPCCGQRRLVDEFRRKYEDYKAKQAHPTVSSKRL